MSNNIISAGIQRSGGKFFLAKKLLRYTRYHKVFLSLFCGACWFELRKKKAEIFEWWNDIDQDLMNYLEIISEVPDLFDEIKEGFFGIVNDKTLKRMLMLLEEPFEITDKETYPISIRIKRAYAFYYVSKLMISKSMSKIGTPELNRPITNQDRGILTPLNLKAIKRLQYIHTTSMDFAECYDKFRKHYQSNSYGIKPKEVLIYADKPYINSDIYHFPEEKHFELAELLNNTEFSFMLSCREDEYNRDMFKEDRFYFVPLKTRYPINVHSESNKGVTELLILNYNPEELGKTIPQMPFEDKLKKTKGKKIVSPKWNITKWIGDKK